MSNTSSTTSREASFTGHDKSRPRSRREKSSPTCGCCGARVVIIGMQIMKKCACDPHATRCFCGRGRCHCRCRPVEKAATA